MRFDPNTVTALVTSIAAAAAVVAVLVAICQTRKNLRVQRDQLRLQTLMQLLTEWQSPQMVNTRARAAVTILKTLYHPYHAGPLAKRPSPSTSMSTAAPWTVRLARTVEKQLDRLLSHDSDAVRAALRAIARAPFSHAKAECLHEHLFGWRPVVRAYRVLYDLDPFGNSLTSYADGGGGVRRAAQHPAFALPVFGFSFHTASRCRESYAMRRCRGRSCSGSFRLTHYH